MRGSIGAHLCETLLHLRALRRSQDVQQLRAEGFHCCGIATAMRRMRGAILLANLAHLRFLRGGKVGRVHGSRKRRHAMVAVATGVALSRLIRGRGRGLLSACT